MLSLFLVKVTKSQLSLRKSVLRVCHERAIISALHSDKQRSELGGRQVALQCGGVVMMGDDMESLHCR